MDVAAGLYLDQIFVSLQLVGNLSLNLIHVLPHIRIQLCVDLISFIIRNYCYMVSLLHQSKTNAL